MKRLSHTLLYMSLAALLTTGCGSDNDTTPGGDDTSVNTNANDASRNSDLARWELPHTTSGNVFIAHRTGDGLMNYCLEYNLQANHSQWVAYRFDKTLAANNTGGKRTDAWNYDPDLSAYREHQLDVQYFYGYQRGHLVGSAERYYSLEANEQTFYMSNMSPMIGNFNGNDWGNGIEVLIRDWGRGMTTGDTLYVVKGGTTDQRLGYATVRNRLGQNIQMVVPKYYFAACLKRLSTGYVYAIGFWIEHKDHKTNGDKTKAVALARECAVTIDRLEELTGLDFFCNMPDVYEDKVEAQMNTSQWSGL